MDRNFLVLVIKMLQLAVIYGHFFIVSSFLWVIWNISNYDV